MSASDVASLPLPYLYTRATDARGRVYYMNHATRATTWLHPIKLAALQAAGLVTPSTASSAVAFVDEPPHTTAAEAQSGAARYERRERAADGRAYWVDNEARTSHWLHPEAVAAGLAGREGAGPAGGGGGGGGGGGAALPDASEWTVRGAEPPWALEEFVAEGLPTARERYVVDYRTDQQRSQSPLDISLAGERLGAERERKGREAAARGMRRGWGVHEKL